MAFFLDALNCKNKGRPPIWLMRQAGRYLPEYRKLKGSHDLYTLFHDVEACVEVTLQPIKRLGVDAAILFSDILTVFDGLGIRYRFEESTGPVVLDPPEKIQSVESEVAYAHIRKIITSLKGELEVPLIGFAGAPFTIASYLIEGKTSRDLRATKKWLFKAPTSFHQLLDKITEATLAYVQLQIEAGVEAIQLFDSWAHVLGFEDFRECSLKPMKRLVEAIQAQGVPVILFCRGSSFFAEELASVHPAAISLDWSGSLPAIRKKIPETIALQGNLDPMVLYGPKEFIQKRVEALLASMEHDQGYLFNLGHGVLPDTPVEHVEFLVDYVQNRSRTFAQA